MGRAKRARGARHDRKPTFGTYNAGGGSRNKWDVIKDQFDKVDVLGLSEFSPSRGLAATLMCRRQEHCPRDPGSIDRREGRACRVSRRATPITL